MDVGAVAGGVAVPAVDMLSARMSLARATHTSHRPGRSGLCATCGRPLDAQAYGAQERPDAETLGRLRLAASGLWEPVVELFQGGVELGSFYRCPAVNAHVGGSHPPTGKPSKHMTGDALDFSPTRLALVPAFELVLAAPTVLFDKAIVESKHLHDRWSLWIHLQRPDPGQAPRRLAFMSFGDGRYPAWNPKDERLQAPALVEA